MFQDGPLTTITPASVPKRVPRSRAGRIAPLAIRRPEGRHIPGAFDRPPRTDAGPTAGSARATNARWAPAGESGRKRFPFNNFTCFLTLFSKCFSSFDHSTCALSVSGQYLALDEIYHPFRAAFPNNSTRRRSFTRARPPSHRRDSHPLWRPVPGNLDRGRTQSILCKLQLGPRRSQISNLSFCRFTRRYWGNPCWFLFLRLLICLSSAGIPTWSEVNLERSWRFGRRRPGLQSGWQSPIRSRTGARRRHCISGTSTREGTRPNTQAALEGCNDARTGMPPGIPEGAMCVQRFDDSRNSAIHITYRISLRSSSMPEPRDPLLKVLMICI